MYIVVHLIFNCQRLLIKYNTNIRDLYITPIYLPNTNYIIYNIYIQYTYITYKYTSYIVKM